jgi:acyl-CoA thioester hydrolase
MTESTPRFELAIAVQDADIDELNHVNNVVYVRWVQEVATAHWRATADPEDQATLGWVVVRHEIDYKRPALPGDDIGAQTWVGAIVGRYYERHVEFRRVSDGRLLARARTLWCPISRRTGRPVDAGERVRARFSASPDGT